MAFSLNRIQLIGNLGKDSETRFTANNLSVTNFTIATTHGYKDKDGQWKNETTWHNCVAFGLSDYFKDNLKKGKKFYVEGRITKNEYTDKEGIKRYSTDVYCEKLIPLDSREGDFNQSGSNSGESFSKRPDSPAPDEGFSQEDNDDLPF